MEPKPTAISKEIVIPQSDKEKRALFDLSVIITLDHIDSITDETERKNIDKFMYDEGILSSSDKDPERAHEEFGLHNDTSRLDERYANIPGDPPLTSPTATAQVYATWMARAHEAMTPGDRTDRANDLLSYQSQEDRKQPNERVLHHLWRELSEQYSHDNDGDALNIRTVDIDTLKPILRKKLDFHIEELQPEELIDAMLSIEVLTQLSGKKSIYNTTAAKMRSIVRQGYPDIYTFIVEEARFHEADIYNIEAIYRKKPLTQNEKDKASITLRTCKIIHSDYVKCDMVFNFAKGLEVKRTSADELQKTAKMLMIDSNPDKSAVRDSEITPTPDDFYKIAAILDRLGLSPPERSEIETWMAAQSTQEINLSPMELNWEILPPGELEDTAREIVNDTNKRSTSHEKKVDLSRLAVLDSIRQFWGASQCYYSRGVRNKRAVIRENDGLEQPDEYIILVLQETDNNGNVLMEHAVAESPIAGPNALYVYRQDAAEHQLGWRSVMATDKARARQLGARRIKHVTASGHNPELVMQAKLEQLLTIPGEDFNRIDFNGVNREGEVIIRQRKLGQKAVDTFTNMEINPA